MDLKFVILIFCLVTLINESSSNAIFTLIHDVVQNNIAGVPAVHQATEWDFHPEEGLKRRVLFESLNGRYGQDLIDRLGMGMGFKGQWGVKVANQAKPDQRYV
ncbi:uncharacterized protein [Venturia canescens]|uniref:uncharacterized protein n=1 Tax=Venturia canescens TaxID=32260 RepID=UPI001C9D2898|nr:uncharacterized protein LOC122418519 [Venturia canescens]